MNKTIISGRITKDPEVRYTQNNTIFTTFTVAVRKRVKEEGKDADFINVIAWNKTAEFVSMYFKKGMQIALVGRLQTRTYDASDGTKRYVTEVVAEEVEFAESKKEEIKKSGYVDDRGDIGYNVDTQADEFSIDVDEGDF